MSTLPRRTIFVRAGSLLAGLALNRGNARPAQAEGPAPAPLYFSVFGPCHLRVDTAAGTVDRIGRWDLPEWHFPGPQPEPLSVELEPLSRDMLVVRRWADEAPESCRLCWGCTAFRDRKGRMTCARPAPLDLDPADAPLWSEREGGGEC